MTPTKKELIEKMARAIWESYIASPLATDRHRELSWDDIVDLAPVAAFAAAIFDTAIAEARDTLAAIVPMDATAEMLAHALPAVDDEHSDADKKLGAAACLILSGGRDIPNEGQAVPVAAGLAEDYRAMVEYGRVK